MNWLCNFFHHWTQWSFPPERHGALRLQYRKCTRCLKTEEHVTNDTHMMTGDPL